MAEIIGVKFKPGGKLYYFKPNDEYLLQGTRVIVETSRGVECGEVVMERHTIPDEQLTHELKNVLRSATDADLARLEENKAKEQSAFATCEKKIAEHKLDMKLVSVEYAFDGSKILFCFTSDGRVDFRDLVKDLASVFRTRIELRQIGVRDEAKMLGGLGICGRPFCCASFMGDFAPVSIKMAKEQGLSLNPVKISGTCGRLMCCLKYEEEAYIDLLRRTPPVDTRVSTPEGDGTIVEVSLLTGMIKVRMDESPEGAPHSFNKRQVRIIGGKPNHSYDTADNLTEEEIAELERIDDSIAESKKTARGKGDRMSQWMGESLQESIDGEPSASDNEVSRPRKPDRADSKGQNPKGGRSSNQQGARRTERQVQPQNRQPNADYDNRQSNGAGQQAGRNRQGPIQPKKPTNQNQGGRNPAKENQGDQRNQNNNSRNQAQATNRQNAAQGAKSPNTQNATVGKISANNAAKQTAYGKIQPKSAGAAQNGGQSKANYSQKKTEGGQQRQGNNQSRQGGSQNRGGGQPRRNPSQQRQNGAGKPHGGGQKQGETRTKPGE